MAGDHLYCGHCGHDWISRTDNPKRCPNCKNTRRYADIEEFDPDKHGEVERR